MSEPSSNANSAKAKEAKIPLEDVMVSLYASQDKIYPRSVSGFFTSWRWVMIWATQIFFYGVPWLNWGCLLYTSRCV